MDKDVEKKRKNAERLRVWRQNRKENETEEDRLNRVLKEREKRCKHKQPQRQHESSDTRDKRKQKDSER